jgi:hypothetical protein
VILLKLRRREQHAKLMFDISHTFAAARPFVNNVLIAVSIRTKPIIGQHLAPRAVAQERSYLAR